MTAARVWSCKESYLHINILEMKTVILSLVAFLPQLLGQSVVPMSDNVTVVAYLQSEGGTVSRVLCHMALDIVLWTERQSVSLSARYIPGKKNVLVDPTQSSQPVFPTEWSLLPRVFEAICEFFGHPHLKLFTTRANAKLSLYISPVMNPMIRKQDTIQHRWDHSLSLRRSSVCSSSASIVKSAAFNRALVSSGGSVVATEGVVRLSFVHVDR